MLNPCFRMIIVLAVLCFVLPQPAFSKNGAGGEPKGRTTLGDLNCNAGEVAKFDGTSWACAPDDFGPSASIVDAFGRELGKVIQVYSCMGLHSWPIHSPALQPWPV